MKQKIKILVITSKKPRSYEQKNWNGLIEEYAPELYETMFAVGERGALEVIEREKPEIVILLHSIKNPMEVLMKVKEMHPECIAFVFLGMVDDEQEAIDEYKKLGAYKAYMPPFVMDTLVHDMFVALNLE